MIRHLTAPRASTRAKYKGTALCQGTLRIPTGEEDLHRVEQQLEHATYAEEQGQ